MARATDRRRSMRPVPQPGFRPSGRHPANEHWLDGCPARRAVVFGLGSVGVLTVAGCAGSAGRTDTTAGPDTGGGTGQPPASGSAPASPGQPGAAPGTSAEPSYAPWPNLGGNQDGLVGTGDVPVGGGVLAGEYLVVQPRSGTFKAFEAKCPHQGIIVDPPLAGRDFMNCPGHNSKFKVADGSRISGPAPRGLRQVAVKVKNGSVVLA
jgi:nitrite reductase/ring-hydroxylating ferredoxin subunit